MNNYNPQFFRDTWSLLKLYWTSTEKWRAYFLLFLILTGLAFEVQVLVYFNSLVNDIYSNLQNFDKAGLMRDMLRYIGVLTAIVLLNAYTAYFSGVLTNRWQRWMTHHYLDRWLDQHNFYAMQVLSKQMDNPDQRISEDLNQLPALTLSLLTGLFSAILSLIAFGIILWNLSGPLTLPLGQLGHVTIPGYMFWCTVAYAIVGTWCTMKIGKNLTLLNYRQQQFNANFRFSLVRVRELSEQIALYNGEGDEKIRLKNLFKYVYDNFFQIIRVQKYLSFFTGSYNYSSYLVGLTIGMPRYFAKKLQVGFLVQVSKAFDQVVGSLSYIVNAYAMIANWRAVINRLSEFTHNIEVAMCEMDRKNIVITKSPNSPLIIENLDLELPNGDKLLEKFSLTIQPGEKILLMGATGSGKSTVLRAVAGLWPFGHGKVILRENEKVLFLPQRPYLPLGNLQTVLAFPSRAQDFTAEQLNEGLALVGLKKLQNDFEKIRNWTQELSLGEQQLIAFARVLLQKPDWLFLDEASSALDESNEVRVYQILRKYLPQTTWLSVGHRSSLRDLHDRCIEIKKDEVTQVSKICYA